MIAAIHQPNYLPWPGYFFKMFMADIFVFLDDVKINKSGYTRRCRLRSTQADGTFIWLSVPIRAFSNLSKINQLRIYRNNWPEKHFDYCKSAYAEAPNGAWLLNMLQPMFENAESYDLLSEWNVFCIGEICRKLGIRNKMILSSSLDLDPAKGAAYTDLICQSIGATHYVRGSGEKKYARNYSWPIDKTKLIETDILNELETLKKDHPPYINGYSIIDLLAYIPVPDLLKLFDTYRSRLLP